MTYMTVCNCAHAVRAIAALCVPLMLAHAADAPPPLVADAPIRLAGVSGRIDHMAIDLRRQRLFVAELGNGSVDAIDLATGKILHRIDGLREPQGVGYAPRSDLLAVASAGDGTVRLYHGEGFTPAGIIELGDDADDVRVDPRTGNFIVGYGSGGVAVIDPQRRAVVGRVELPAHPEGFQLDAASGRGFVNLPDARQIAVVDIATDKLEATWRPPGLLGNFPMALDDNGGLVAIVYRNPPRLVLFDAHTGVATASLATCGDADDVFFDARRRRVYVSCGEGSVDVMQQGPPGFQRLASVKTASGARTALFVPELDRLIVAARAGFFGPGSDAAILVFRPQP
jgi:DNA-binding beta-propeller fold protein YncE